MFTRVKTAQELNAMRESGAMLAHVLGVLKDRLEIGMTTKDLSEIAKQELRPLGGTPTFLGYQGFPDVLCVSLNDEVVHGIPSTRKIIGTGDIVSMDFGVTYKGMITDSAISLIAGRPKDKKINQLVDTTRQALDMGISVLKDGISVGDIAFTIQSVLDEHKYGIIKDLVGHGVGHQLHEEPNIPNYGKLHTGPILKAGMTIAIEPMATLGEHLVYVDNDGWTVKTRDGGLAAHFEHTILIKENGAEILTAK